MSNLGQYFTTDNTLKEQLFNFILNNPNEILEPSIGQGDLVHYIKSKQALIKFDCYEIDKTIFFLPGIENVIYGDFLEQQITKKYKTIVGNPPYVRTQKGNLYIDFTKKCFNLLEEGGELIFIIPSDFFKLTSSKNLLNEMMSAGNFTHIYHPHNEHLFKNATIDVLIYRYCKNATLPKTVLYNDKQLYVINNNGMITFSDSILRETIGDYFDAYVGMVSGKESVFKNEQFGNITFLHGEKYIYIKKFPTDNPELNKYMLSKKKELLDRKIRTFNESNWFEWGAPRNISIIKEHFGKECIYIYNLTRNETVAFKGTVNYFGGNLIMLISKRKIDLQKVIDYLNCSEFKTNFMFSGRFKIGHRQLLNSQIKL